MENLHETKQEKEAADYSAYLQLKNLNYSNTRIAEHISYTKQELGNLISTYYFVNNLEYQIQENEEENYFFNGTFYITKSVEETLTSEEIIEIYQFVQDLVKQHNGIDYLQTFYSIEHNCKLFFIDQLNSSMIENKQYSDKENYCTLMLSSDY